MLTFSSIALEAKCCLHGICIYRSHKLDVEPTDKKCTSQFDLILMNINHICHEFSFFIYRHCTSTVDDDTLYIHGWNYVEKELNVEEMEIHDMRHCLVSFITCAPCIKST